MNDLELIRLTDFFKALGDPARVRILCLLLEGEECVGGLADRLQMTQSAVSHQLTVLKNHRLVGSRREGKQVYYALADEHVRMVIGMGMELSLIHILICIEPVSFLSSFTERIPAGCVGNLERMCVFRGETKGRGQTGGWHSKSTVAFTPSSVFSIIQRAPCRLKIICAR